MNNAEKPDDAKPKRRENLYKISDVSRKLSITPRTVRFYEQMGLLPQTKRTQGKMRLFDDQDLTRIQEVRRLQKEKSMSLEQIKLYLNDQGQLDEGTLQQKLFRIVTDVTCSLPDEFFTEHHVERLPIFIKLDKQVYTDKNSLTNSELFSEVRRRGVYPGTLPPDDKTIQSFFKKLSADGAEQVLVISISSRLSETYQIVSRQATRFRDMHIEVLDSRTSAAGLGLLVCEAVRLKEDGISLHSIKTRLELMLPHIFQVFTVSSLEHLYNSGRVSPEVSGYMSLLLNFKPVLMLRGGKGYIELAGRSEDSVGAYDKMFELFLRAIEGKGDPRMLGIVYNGLSTEAEALLKNVQQQYPGAQTVMAEGHPVLGVHLGPQSVGLAVVTE